MHFESFLQFEISLTALLESIHLFTYYASIILYYAFYYAGIFDAGLIFAKDMPDWGQC